MAGDHRFASLDTNTYLPADSPEFDAKLILGDSSATPSKITQPSRNELEQVVPLRLAEALP